MNASAKRSLSLLASIAVLEWITACRSTGTPKEEILRAGGKIEQLLDGGSAVILSGSGVEDHDMLALAALADNHPEYEPIRRIDISGSNVSNAGLEALTDLNLLESLKLEGTQVTKDGIRRFQEKVPHCQVVP